MVIRCNGFASSNTDLPQSILKVTAVLKGKVEGQVIFNDCSSWENSSPSWPSGEIFADGFAQTGFAE